MITDGKKKYKTEDMFPQRYITILSLKVHSKARNSEAFEAFKPIQGLSRATMGCLWMALKWLDDIFEAHGNLSHRCIFTYL